TSIYTQKKLPFLNSNYKLMKTSDRILLTFFLLIFLTAFASMVALKQKVNSKEFTVIEWMGKTEPKTKTTPLPDITTDRPVRVVRVVRPGPGLLDCNIIPSDSPRIQYRTIKLQQDHFPRDSVRVKQIADTLIIEYAGPIQPGENFVEYRVDVDLWLPSWEKL